MPFPVDTKYVIETERKLGVTFPASFVARMVKDNGGEASIPPDAWQLYPFLDTSDRKRLARTCNGIVRETTQAKKWSAFPADAIAIGSNGCGDQLVLLPQPNAPDCLGREVYWWAHEAGELHKVADDFGQIAS
jgi:hypothetical protein